MTDKQALLERMLSMPDPLETPEGRGMSYLLMMGQEARDDIRAYFEANPRGLF